MTTPVPGTGSTTDWHAHMLSDQLRPPRQAQGRWPGIRAVRDGPGHELTLGGRFYRHVDERTFDPDRRLRDMDAWGITRQVISAPPYAVAFSGPRAEFAELARQQNAFLGDVVAAHPDRFAMWGLLPYGDDDLLLDECRRLENLPGVVGVCLTAYLDDHLCDPASAALWRRIAGNGWVVFVHPADTSMCDCDTGSGAVFGAGMPTSTGRTAVRLIASGVLAEVPDVRFLLAHAGGTLPAVLDRMDHGWRMGAQHQQLDEPPSTYARRAFWVDSIAYGQTSLRFAGDMLGWDRVVYGSDYPFAAVLDPVMLEDLAGSDLRWQVMHTNSEALFGTIGGPPGSRT